MTIEPEDEGRQRVEAASAFDKHLLAVSRSGGTMPPLAELMARTMSQDARDQLTVTTVVSDREQPGETIVGAARQRIPEAAALDKVEVFVADHNDEQFLFSLWPSGFDAVWHLVSTVPYTSDEWSRVDRIVRRSAPAIASVQLDEQELPSICHMLSEHGRVQVSRMTARITRDHSSYTRGWPSEAPLPKPSYTEALGEIEGRGTVRTLTVTVGNRLNVHLRKRAGATFYGGEPELFCEVVLNRLARAASLRADAFRNRQRRHREPVGDPLAVHVQDGQFTDREQLRGFVADLDTVSDLGVTVLHGNPYLHLTVTDYRDGSNYNMFVTDGRQIRIYPGFRASMGSLARIADEVGEIVSAVAINDAEPSRPLTRDDFLAGA